MSRDIKYIGMDVHKEAIVIAVLNGSGKLVSSAPHSFLWGDHGNALNLFRS